jgi:predicted Zn-dependent peptidase
MQADYNTYTLSNGIRLIHSQTKSEVAHFGLLVHTGTRDEQTNEHGLAHFMEHMFFKGTKKRSPFKIISRLEDVGGEINAYTSKEETAIHASFLKGDFKKAAELIHDIFFNSTFSIKERKKEAEVILSEIQTYEDTPAELIFDQAEEILFPNHSIGRNILGTKESLGLFQNGLVETFRSDNYSTEEIVICSVGNIPFKKIFSQLETLFQEHDMVSRSRKRIVPVGTTGITTKIDRNTYQSHCIISGEAYSFANKDRIGLHLLNNILGGPGMNSRLNMALREKRGYSYSAESHYIEYTDTGALNIYFSCDKPRLKKCLEITNSELSNLRKNLIPPTKLTYARRQLLGQIAISSENSENLMLNMAKSHLLFNRVDSLKDISEKLEAIDANKLRDIANEIFDPSKLNTLIYK